MLDIMYEIPSKGNVKEVIISDEVISAKAEPKLVLKSEEETAKSKDSGAESA